MKIVVNTRLLRLNQMDGIGWFTYNTLKHIVNENPDIDFHFLFDSGIDDEFVFGRNVTPHNLFPPAKHALLNLVWFEGAVYGVLKKTQPDLFLSPDGILCLRWNGKQYGVMHDINYFHNPKDLKWSNRTYYNFFFPRYANKACRIGTVSEYSKTDIVTNYHINSNKIDVLYNGINPFFKPLPEFEKESVRSSLTAGFDYFLFIGTLHPRKNLLRLLDAFDVFKSRTGSDVKLVVAGKGLYKVEEIYNRHKRMQSSADVIFTGRLEDDKLNKVLAAALALTFVPIFEGFGIPIIEAMQCDVPVICSNVTSMPEVAGEAALLVDPTNVEQIAQAMVKVFEDKRLRKDLIEKGRLQKEKFSWERSANLLWGGVTKCL